MKALFYGGAISTLAGLALGMGMELPANPPPTGADAQPVAQQVADGTSESVTYGVPADSYPPSYVIDAAYNGQPVTELRAEPAVFDDPAPAERVIETSWTAPAAPAATPQDVAAAGDTTTAPTPEQAPADVRTYASIDAVLNQQQAEPAPAAGPSI